MKEVIIDSGIPCYEIEGYFEKVAKPLQPGEYVGVQWEVAVNKLKDQGYKHMRIPRTQLVFKGEDEAVDRAVQQYRRAFLRGGA